MSAEQEWKPIEPAEFERYLETHFAEMLEHAHDCYIPTGWQQIVQHLIEDISNVTDELKIEQIKEKFATLRFYYQLDTKHESDKRIVSALVRMAEGLSARTCQDCGYSDWSDVRARNDLGWIKTLCIDCYLPLKAEAERKRAERANASSS